MLEQREKAYQFGIVPLLQVLRTFLNDLQQMIDCQTGDWRIQN